MLSRLSTKSGRALSRAALRASLARSTPKDARRAFVQPSGADRASVVEVPSAYQEDTAFSPRVGQCSCLGPCVKKNKLTDSLAQICSASSLRHPVVKAGLPRRPVPSTSTCRSVCSVLAVHTVQPSHLPQGHHSSGPPGAGRHATFSHRPVRQPSQSDPCLWVGGRKGG